MSTPQGTNRPIIGPGWILGSVLSGVLVAGGLSTEGMVGTVLAIALALTSILLAIGFAAEKVIDGLGPQRNVEPSSRAGSP